MATSTQVQVGARTAPGMNQFLNNMAKPDAAALTENSKKIEMLASFLGPEKIGAQKRLGMSQYLLERLTDVKNDVRKLANLEGWDSKQTSEYYRGVLEEVSGGASQKRQFAGWEGGGSSLSPLDFEFAGVDQYMNDMGLPMLSDHMLEKFQNMMTAQYITNQMVSPSPEFSQEMVMAAIVPIARSMIPNTVFLKAFITDMAIGELSKPYVLKDRYKAFQLGLNVLATHNPPMELQNYDPVLVTPEEWDRVVAIDMKYVETMNFDVAADILSDGGRELQVLIDVQGFTGLDSALPNQTVPSAGSTGVGYVLDSTQTIMTLEAGQPPLIDHLNVVNQTLRQRGYNPDLILTSPYELGAMMSQQAILMAYAYGTREVQETGLVGTLVGNAVAWSPNTVFGGVASSYGFYVCDSDELARIVLGFPITVYPFFMRRQIQFEMYTRLEIFFRNTQAAMKVQCNNLVKGVA